MKRGKGVSDSFEAYLSAKDTLASVHAHVTVDLGLDLKERHIAELFLIGFAIGHFMAKEGRAPTPLELEGLSTERN